MSRLAQRFTSRPGAPPSGRSAAKEEAERERRRKLNRLCVSMVVIFGACWLPLNSINFVRDVDAAPVHCWRFYHAAFFGCHIVAMSSNCYNPFLYGWLNDAFRYHMESMCSILFVGLCNWWDQVTMPSWKQNCTYLHSQRSNKVTLAGAGRGNKIASYSTVISTRTPRLVQSWCQSS